MENIDPRDVTPGARLAQFIKRTNNHCYMQNIEALGFVISEKKILLVLSVSHCKSMETIMWALWFQRMRFFNFFFFFSFKYMLPWQPEF